MEKANTSKQNEIQVEEALNAIDLINKAAKMAGKGTQCLFGVIDREPVAIVCGTALELSSGNDAGVVGVKQLVQTGIKLVRI